MADARPLHVLARPVAIGHDRRQLLALGSIDNHTDRLSHGLFPQTWPSLAYPTAPVNPLNGSKNALMETLFSRTVVNTSFVVTCAKELTMT